ncbi:MAG: lysophospholipid acyltransferase family protein [Alphaproteobacteria bacterium]
MFANVRGGILACVFLVVTVVLMPVQQVLVWAGLRWAGTLPAHYHRFVLWLLSIRVHVSGQINPGATFLVANHVSWLDIVVIGSLAPLSFVAKREVGRWPLFGSLARLQRTIFVDRERRTGTRGAMAALERRFARGDAMVLFAEGTSSDGNQVLPFRSALFGAAGLAQRAPAGQSGQGVPVQPLSIAYTHVHGLPMGRQFRPRYAWYGDMELPAHLWGVFCSGPIDVAITLHRVVSQQDFADRKQLAHYCEAQVRAGVLTGLMGRQILSAGEAPPGPANLPSTAQPAMHQPNSAISPNPAISNEAQ